MERFLKRYWGYLLIATLFILWIKTPVDPLILAGGFLVGLAYMMFVAPAWCGATTRSGEPCRKNAQGVLLGCSYRQHKWQKVQHFPQLVKSVTLGASNLVGSASAAIAAVAALVAAVKAM